MIERRIDDDSTLLTPATCRDHGWRVMLLCSRGCPARRLAMDWRMQGVWESDWADVFRSTKFVCRCEAQADGLRIERETREGFEELLFLET